MNAARDPLDRLAPKVDFDGPDGCWTWLGYVRPDGYGSFMDADQRTVLPHRWLYLTTVEAIGPDMQLDHLCRNRTCVNPDHLEPVLPGENTRRGVGPAVWHRVRAEEATGKCAGGHAWSPETTYYRPTDGFRECRVCRRERDSRRNQSAERAARRKVPA